MTEVSQQERERLTLTATVKGDKESVDEMMDLIIHLVANKKIKLEKLVITNV